MELENIRTFEDFMLEELRDNCEDLFDLYSKRYDEYVYLQELLQQQREKKKLFQDIKAGLRKEQKTEKIQNENELKNEIEKIIGNLEESKHYGIHMISIGPKSVSFRFISCKRKSGPIIGNMALGWKDGYYKSGLRIDYDGEQCGRTNKFTVEEQKLADTIRQSIIEPWKKLRDLYQERKLFSI